MKKRLVIFLFMMLLISLPITTSKMFFYHTDHLGSPRVITDEKGEVVSEINYLPFGSELSESDEKLKYNSKELDESGLYYYNARYYDSDVGRFITPDSVEKFPNPYVYVSNNPMKYIDLFGEEYRLFDKREVSREIMDSRDYGATFLTEFGEEAKIVANQRVNEINKKLFGREVITIKNDDLNIKNGLKFNNKDQQKLYDFLFEAINTDYLIVLNLDSYASGSGGDINSKNGIKDIRMFLSRVIIRYPEEGEKYIGLGKGGTNIKKDFAGIFIHEIAHSFYWHKADDPEGKNYGSWNEEIAVNLQNVARKIMGLEKRVYYSDGATPEEWDNIGIEIRNKRIRKGNENLFKKVY